MSLAELVRTYQLESTSHARERILSQLTESKYTCIATLTLY
jgi:hypothetical protein